MRKLMKPLVRQTDESRPSRVLIFRQSPRRMKTTKNPSGCERGPLEPIVAHIGDSAFLLRRVSSCGVRTDWPGVQWPHK